MNIVHNKGALLSSRDWEVIAAAFKRSKYQNAVTTLMERNNIPTPAHEVLPEEAVNQGNDSINNILRAKKIPFQLSRIGRWRRGEQRRDRLLAFVCKHK